MILWLNGTFGSGKTSTAAELLPLLPGHRLFDPEVVGQMLAVNLQDIEVADFQDHPPWRPLVASTAVAIVDYTGRSLIAVQTLLVQDYAEEIFDGLAQAGQTVFHVVLDADEAVLRERIEASGDAVEWRLDHLPTYASNRAWMTASADLVLDVGLLTPAAAAAQIVARLPDRRPAAIRPGEGGVSATPPA